MDAAFATRPGRNAPAEEAGPGQLELGFEPGLSRAGAPELEELAAELESLRAGEQWRLGLEHALEILQSDRAEFYRYVYSNRERSNWSDDAVEEFGPESAEALLGFLEYLGHEDARSVLRRAGFYFGDVELMHWLEFFQSVSLSRMQSLEVEEDLLETAAAGCMQFADAAEFYCHCMFDQKRFIEFASSLYLERECVEDHHLSRALLREFLNEQFRQRNIVWEDLSRGVHPRLRQVARRLGILSEADAAAADAQSAETGGPLTEESRRALQELELLPVGDRLPAHNIVQSQYRALLKRWHPDLNPGAAQHASQEKTRALVAAYNVLIACY